jgi:predicted small lipoprotein YifL
MVSKGLGFRTLLLVALIGVAGCGQSELTPAQKAAQAQRQQRAEAEAEARQQRAEAEAAVRQRRAEAEAEEAGLMADFRVAGPELKRTGPRRCCRRPGAC